ncbi:MAG: DUF721 domain-containing protein [Thermodesulfovibrionales bacterium]
MNKIGNLLSPFVKSLGLEGALQLEAIETEWTKIFGEPLSLHTCPANLQNGGLLIHVDSPVWLQQISFYTDDIVKKLRPFGVKEVRLRLGKIRARKKTLTPESAEIQYVSLDSDTLHYIEDLVSGINDRELRECITQAMEKSFSRRTKNEE